MDGGVVAVEGGGYARRDDQRWVGGGCGVAGGCRLTIHINFHRLKIAFGKTYGHIELIIIVMIQGGPKMICLAHVSKVSKSLGYNLLNIKVGVIQKCSRY